MKKITLALCMFLSLMQFSFAQGKTLKFNEKGELKIVQLTDLHFTDNPVEAKRTFSRMDFIVMSEKPDFIAVTGDLIFSKPARENLDKILRKLDSYKIPFCIVFGNHDAEQEMSREEMSQMIAFSKFSMNSLNEAGQLADVRIPVISSLDEMKAPLDLYFLDSHDYSTMPETVGGYAWFTFDQIAWLRQQCEAATSANEGEHVPSLAFFHIPLPEFYDAWIEAESQKHNSVVGIRGEYGGHPRVNSGMYTAMLETGNIMGVFCGHDHDSDYIVPYNGIALAYGRYSGDDTVYNHLAHGTRVILLKEGERAFTTWIHEDDNRIQYKVRFADGKLE